ncbi:MAG: hypothetical protein H5T62_07030 [Anaerolineae bacterium]|nr:hypothetical protein [Anaerolineae bacterium]
MGWGNKPLALREVLSIGGERRNATMSILDRFTHSEQLSLEELLTETDQQDEQTIANHKTHLVHYVFRPGSPGQKVPDLTPDQVLAWALDAFHKQFGEPPWVVVCHPTWAEAVRAALNGDDHIAVVPVGGCLVPELWLARPEMEQSHDR